MTGLLAPTDDSRTGTHKRRVLCPVCNQERIVYANSNSIPCRTCSALSRKNGRTIACPTCGNEHYVTPSMEAKGIRHCSITCSSRRKRPPFSAGHRERLAESKRGKRNPNYRHGKRDDPGRGWSLGAKGEALCRACGDTAVHLHHAVPRKVNPAGKRDLRNGLPLCRSCHFSWHRNKRPTLSRGVFTEEEWAFIGTLVPPTWLDMHYPARLPEDAGGIEAARIRLAPVEHREEVEQSAVAA